MAASPSGELHDFLEDDLKSWYPELANKIRITLVEALPSVLPMFSKQLIEYTESTFKESKIDILTKTMVKQVCVAVTCKGPQHWIS
jgi:NADH:ubiquinone reductase (non-electrogenic)